MNRRGMGERPDTDAVLAGLKGFQRDTVDYAFERLYTATDSTRRFLVADEVGLGKTLVARGVIAKALDHLWDGPGRVEQIDIVYICSNAQIARQNVRRLQIGDGKFVRAARLTLLPQVIHNLRANRVNYIALTPGTSFDLKSSMGIRQERVLLYHMVQRVWPNSRAGPKNLFQGDVKNTGHFRWELKQFKHWHRIDPGIADAFAHRLREGEGLQARYEDLCQRFRRSRPRIPGDDRWRQITFIGQLRSMLAEVCVDALEPDLVILDEFQRFKDLLDGEHATAKLAKQLFTYSDDTSDVRLLLLSATPYKMYTLHHERAEDDHYRDFLRTVEFLDLGLKESGDLRRLLDEYRQAMYRIESGTDDLVRVKEQIEAHLRRVMSRTERLRISGDAQGMMRQVPSTGLELTAADVGDFLALQKIGREVRQPQVLEYWKSAPYLLSFMDDYKLKTEVVANLAASSENGLAKLLTEGGRAFLSWEDVEAYARLDPANARLRSLLGWMERGEAWKLLWLPPALPYYAESGPESGPWKAAREQQFSKRLIFSTWAVVPKAVASVVSYEVERRLFQRFDDSIRNTAEERKKRRALLRFAYSNERLTGMPVLGLLYPSPTLVELGDPVPVSGAEVTLADAVDQARTQLEPLLDRLTKPYLDGEREDESWYWAAPILLDLQRYGESTKEWFGRWDLPKIWNGAQEDDDEGSRWADHVREARKFVEAGVEAALRGSLELGRPPEDLAEALATRAVAGPATSALRALTRASGPGTASALAARDAAARIAWSFRTLFNLPEAMALIRGGRRDHETAPYWRQVVDYCAAGNLQAVLDEYIHTLRDLEGLFAADDEEAWEKLAGAVTAALSLRTGAPRVDEIRPDDDTVRIHHRRLRNHFAMRFGAQESDDGKTGAREGQVRQAFNSPFWPFVLASTSVGQEGLDFHAYCHSVMHWNLPSNPVDLEQREGRVHRYKGHAVRKNVATKHGDEVLADASKDVWHTLFEAARKQSAEGGGLVPYWLFPLADGAYIERHVPALPLSRDASQLEALKRSLAVYRMVFGQPRQDDLMTFLLERCGPETLRKVEPLLRIDLSPAPAPTVRPGAV
ncbi:helicase-related protein [Candidatus Palauibacter sp.]|uniref:DEAD/DEAH box helicase n=1 Tax=Candidatus Palauibacter sp. TaxID=3101350 RepID=UPI003B011BE8